MPQKRSTFSVNLVLLLQLLISVLAYEYGVVIRGIRNDIVVTANKSPDSVVLSENNLNLQGYPYIGKECVGVFTGITFKSFSASESIDTYVYGSLSTLFAATPWLDTECQSRTRQQVCMLSIGNTVPASSKYHRPFIAEGNVTYCTSTCTSYFEEGACADFSTFLMDPSQRQQYRVSLAITIIYSLQFCSDFLCRMCSKFVYFQHPIACRAPCPM